MRLLNWLKTPAAPVVPAQVEEHSCPGLARVLERLVGRETQPDVLDLGSGLASVYLADRGARVSVEPFDPPPLDEPTRDPDGAARKVELLTIAQPDGKFDLIVAWEAADFVSPERLAEFAAECRRVLAPSGWILLYAQDRPGERMWQDRPGGFRLTADDRMVRVPIAGPSRPRWNHPNRAIERAFAPLSIQSIHLQRNRVREILAQRTILRRVSSAGGACLTD